MTLLLSGSLLLNHPSHEEIFSTIYQMGTWTSEGFAQSGSQIDITQEYVTYLQKFLEENEIKTVLDIGCGDWAFSRYIDWTGIEYTGIDVVQDVIHRNQAQFSSPNITFIHENFLEMELPEADLILCKDVFQHLSNPDVLKTIKHCSKSKHCLITNYFDPSTNNIEIQTGLYRPIDLTAPPFNLPCKKVLSFFSGVAFKQTFHIRN